MPRGVYPRKKKSDAGTPAQPGRRKAVDGAAAALEQLRAERVKLENRIVAIGTAIDALEALES
jgi:hypothetical protein